MIPAAFSSLGTTAVQSATVTRSRSTYRIPGASSAIFSGRGSVYVSMSFNLGAPHVNSTVLAAPGLENGSTSSVIRAVELHVDSALADRQRIHWSVAPEITDRASAAA